MTNRRRIIARGGFFLAVVLGIWWSWRSSGDDVVRALGDADRWHVALSGALTFAGVLLTSLAWLVSLSSFGAPTRAGYAVAPFFVAQLGKYVPGAVWSFAAQGALGAAHRVPARVAATAAVLFLGIHVSSGLTLVGLAGWWAQVPRPAVCVALVAGLVGLAPAVYRTLGSRLAARPCRWKVGHSLRGLVVMVPAWTCYALALAVLTPSPTPSVTLSLGCSFALAFAVGVAVPIAPAGLGARDGALIVLAAPVIGVGPAGALAVLNRLLHTAADVVLGGISSIVMRRRGRRASSGYPSDPD